MPAIRLVATTALAFTAALAFAETPAPRATPREALGQLKAGNDRFARNASQPVSLSINRRRELSAADRPLAMVLSCADSRVPPEHIFNVGLGDLLVIRSGGGVVDRSILATIEYGATSLHTPLLVVMGHESCDVVRAAADAKGTAQTPNLDYLYKAIKAGPRRPRGEDEEARALILDNIEQVINDTLAKSPLVRGLVDGGELDVVGAYYELVSGRVVFSDPVRSAVSSQPASRLPASRPFPAAAH
jgi:carbonic anhydrase